MKNRRIFREFGMITDEVFVRCSEYHDGNIILQAGDLTLSGTRHDIEAKLQGVMHQWPASTGRVLQMVLRGKVRATSSGAEETSGCEYRDLEVAHAHIHLVAQDRVIGELTVVDSAGLEAARFASGPRPGETVH